MWHVGRGKAPDVSKLEKPTIILLQILANDNAYIHTYHSRFSPEGVAESKHMFYTML
jgi:hypothetical protein